MSNLIKMNDYTKMVINDFADNSLNAIDMTLGNGHDSAFLASKFKHVYAFDIQVEAINSSKDKLKNFDNISFFLDNHLHFDKYELTDIKVFVFNLGYLPGSNKKIKTQSTNTIKTLNKVLKFMGLDALISITIYPGHEEGSKEKDAIEKWISNIPNNFHITRYSVVNNKRAPYVISIHKIKEDMI